MKKVLIVIVTHNSHQFIKWATEPFMSFNDIFKVRIIDSGSSDTNYLAGFSSYKNFEVYLEDNIGFAKANNKALFDIECYDYVLFLNPDARVEVDTLNSLLLRAEQESYKKHGMFSVSLVRYDFQKQAPTEYYDSQGIYCDGIGRWKDIQGRVTDVAKQSVDALCGAFLLCRVEALLGSRDSAGNIGFEEKYFMYKEDIELSLRISKKWELFSFKDLTAFHCRGWNKDRTAVPYWARLLSAKNDIDIALRYKLRALPFALFKLAYVKYLEK